MDLLRINVNAKSSMKSAPNGARPDISYYPKINPRKCGEYSGGERLPTIQMRVMKFSRRLFERKRAGAERAAEQ